MSLMLDILKESNNTQHSGDAGKENPHKHGKAAEKMRRVSG
jgi:hypothetical protein